MQMRKLAPTSHHVVPVSLGGTDDDINLVDDVPCKRHSKFHEWADNRLIDQNLRMIAINSIGSEHCVHPHLLDGVLHSAFSDPTHLYVPTAFHQVLDRGAIVKSLRAVDFTIEHWRTELASVRAVLTTLLYEGEAFPTEDTDNVLQDKFLRFTSSTNIGEGMQELLGETIGNKRVWVNSLRGKVRRDLMTAAKSARPIKAHRRANEFIPLLEQHEDKLAGFIDRRIKEQRKVWGEIARYLPPQEPARGISVA